MGRLIAAFKQFSDGEGVPIPGGKLLFRENRIDTKKDVFSDVDLSNVRANPVTLDGEGFCPPVFGDGIYGIDLFLADGATFVIGFEDVSPEGGSGTGAFENWIGTIDYTPPAYVTGSDGNTYKALASSEDVDPVTDDGDTWERVEFVTYWVKSKTYTLGQKVKDVNNNVYKSLKNSNLNNDTVSDNGVNWELDNPVQTWVTGRTYAVGAKVFGSDERKYKAVLSQAGNDPAVDSGTNWLPTDGVVDKPDNVSPANNDTGVARMPTLVGSSYSVSGSTSEHEWSSFQVFFDVGLTNLAYESDITNNLESHKIKTSLAAATDFYWNILYKGVRTDLSELSTATKFTTTLNLSESFDNVTFTGLGGAQSVIGTPDLSSNTGAIFLTNTSTTDSLRIVDTARGVGNAFIIPGIIETAEATGIIAFNFNGYDVGADTAYNGSGNLIWSLILKRTAKFFDMVQTSGDGANRIVAHAVDDEIGFMVVCQQTGAGPSAGPSNYCWFRGMSGSELFRFGSGQSILTSSLVWNSTAPTSTEFSLGTSNNVNGTARDYTTYLVSHNPNAGTYCAKFTVTGTATNKIVTTFPVTTVFLKKDSLDDWIIIDKKLGTGSQIDFDNQAQLVPGNNISSFDSDGVTLSNLSAGDWFIASIADPDLLNL